MPTPLLCQTQYLGAPGELPPMPVVSKEGKEGRRERKEGWGSGQSMSNTESPLMLGGQLGHHLAAVLSPTQPYLLRSDLLPTCGVLSGRPGRGDGKAAFCSLTH